MKRPPVKTPMKKQLQRAKESEFMLGVQCGANAAKHLIKSGWTNMEKLEAEVSSRIRGKRSNP